MFTKLMLLALSVFSPMRLVAHTLDFDLALILAQEFTLGRPCLGSELNSGGNKREDDGSLTIDGIIYHFYVRDGTDKQFIGCKPSIVFWDDYGGDRYVVWAPRIGIFLADGQTLDSLKKRRRVLRSSARDYLRGASCSTAMLNLLSQLDGSDQQSAVDRMFGTPPVEEEDIKCLISQMGSRASVLNDNFAPPYSSDEGIYYHGKKYRGELIEILLPNLFGIKISMLGGFSKNEEERTRLEDAWAHWAACRFKNSACLADDVGK